MFLQRAFDEVSNLITMTSLLGAKGGLWTHKLIWLMEREGKIYYRKGKRKAHMGKGEGKMNDGGASPCSLYAYWNE